MTSYNHFSSIASTGLYVQPQSDIYIHVPGNYQMRTRQDFLQDFSFIS